ncbi:ATP-grasp domain-containing protein [Streptomyces sp. NPDC051684]|uniref:ATP-grasp domain-containing protein n=1 Tax=Streptomyces sp. NPDC051684 TaxID=3365670 RepID=UPI003799BBC1
MKAVLIVLSAGQREYREAALARIAAHYRIALISPAPVTWETPYVIDQVTVDPADSAGYIDAALRLATVHQVAGVFTFDEWCVEKAARIGRLLDVPQCTQEAALRCRDKWATREALRTAGVPSARSELVRSVSEAESAAGRIGYPVVVKPQAMSASFGVTRVPGPDGLAEAFGRAHGSRPKRAWEHQQGVLVEEFLDGPEISVDSTAVGGRVESPVFAKKVLGYPPTFEEVGHIVAAPERITTDPEAVRKVVTAAHEALDVSGTVTHTELRLTTKGPRIVELNGRPGGGLIAELSLLATGVDIALASADVAAGRAPNLKASRDRVAGIRFFYAESAGVIQSCDIGDTVARAPWLEKVQWLVGPGTEVCPEPGRRWFSRVGFAVVTAESVAECEARLAEAADQVTLRIAPQDRQAEHRKDTARSGLL